MSKENKAKFVQGNHACVLGALRAGCNFFSGYPITPSSEIAELLAGELPKIGGKFIQMEDEIGAMGCIIGASLTGKKALTATSGPGFSLKQENLGYAIMTEVPCVVVNVQRGGPSTGLPTQSAQGDMMQARWGTHGDHEIIALCPTTIPEVYMQTIRAFNLAEKYRTPVILLLDEILGHMRELLVEPPDEDIVIFNRSKPDVSPENYLPYELVDSDVPAMADFGSGYRYHVTGLSHDETGFPTNDPEKIDLHMKRLNRKITRYIDEIIEVDQDNVEDADILIFSYGSSARSAKQALLLAAKEDLKVGLFRPVTIWPFPDKMLENAIKGKKAIIVCEANNGQLLREVQRVVQGKVDIQFVGSLNGEPITPLEILEATKKVS